MCDAIVAIFGPPLVTEAKDVALSALVGDHAEIAELDANPVAVGPEGALILDARVPAASPGRPEPSLRG